MKSVVAIVSLGLLLAACVAYNVKDDGTVRARLNQTVKVADFQLTPLEVIEDSRCPANVQCVWAGRLRLKARIDLGGKATEQELTLGEEQPVGRGTLRLIEAKPHPEQGRTIYPEDYRFGFTYSANAAN
jgi:hypothetical protein